MVQESMKADRNEFTVPLTYGPITYGKHRKEWEALRGISERDGACAINFFSNQPALNYGFYQSGSGKNRGSSPLMMRDRRQRWQRWKMS